MNLENVTTYSSQARPFKENILSSRLAKDGKVGKNRRECFVSTIRRENAWWMADLGEEIFINSVGFLITEGSMKMSEKIQIELSNNSHLFTSCGDPWIWNRSPDHVAYRRCAADGGIWARYVRIKSTLSNDSVSELVLCEVQINSGVVPLRQCRHRGFSLSTNKPFKETLKNTTLEAQCNKGYWPRSIQRLTCGTFGYWSNVDCRKSEMKSLKMQYCCYWLTCYCCVSIKAGLED